MLEEIHDKIRLCRHCNLCQLLPAGFTPVPGFGICNNIMLVGEAPGENEIEVGMPFVGAAGKMLDKILESVKLNRNKIYIANTVNCRPHNNGENRPPTAKEIKACKGWLWEQIKIVQPTLIFTMGIVPTKTLLKGIVTSKDKMRDLVGRQFEVSYTSAKIVPVYHPSFLLQYGRKYTEETIKVFKEVIHEL